MKTCFNQTYIPFLWILHTQLNQNGWPKCHRTTLYGPCASCDAPLTKHSKKILGTFLVPWEQALVYHKFKDPFLSWGLSITPAIPSVQLWTFLQGQEFWETLRMSAADPWTKSSGSRGYDFPMSLPLHES